MHTEQVCRKLFLDILKEKSYFFKNDHGSLTKTQRQLETKVQNISFTKLGTVGPRRAPLRIGQNKLEASLGYVVSLSLACLHDDIPSPISGALDFVLFLFLAERGSLLYSPGDPPASASLMLELQLCVTIPSLLNVFFCYCCCFSTHDFSEDADHPGTHFVDRLPLPPKSWDQGVHHHTRPSCTFFNFILHSNRSSPHLGHFL